MTSAEELNARFKELLAVDGNGAVEAHLPDGVPLRAVLVGPIKTWWGKLDTEEYKVYTAWRELVRAELINNGCLVYAPHRAWSGGWHESAQLVNDLAIMESDFVVSVTPPGVEAKGTEAELEVARRANVAVLHSPPGGLDEIKTLLNAVLALRLRKN